MTRLLSGLVIGTAGLCFLAVSQRAQAQTINGGTGSGFSLGDSANYAVLYEGSGGHNLQINSSPLSNATIRGNIGLGDENGGNPQAQFNNPAVIVGNINFASPTASLNVGNAVVNGSTNVGVTQVETDLNAVNTLSIQLSNEVGTAISLSHLGNGQTQTINANSGTLDAYGNEVFTVSALNFQNGSTLIINGDGSHNVVFNFLNLGSGLHFAGTVTLTGGITQDQVLYNIEGGNDLTISGGTTLQTAANNSTQHGVYLDPNGVININSVNLDGRLFGGDSTDMMIVSGATINSVPEPSSFSLVCISCLFSLGLWSRRRSRR